MLSLQYYILKSQILIKINITNFHHNVSFLFITLYFMIVYVYIFIAVGSILKQTKRKHQ
jgi:hypothetical protein